MEKQEKVDWWDDLSKRDRKKLSWEDLTAEERESYINQDCTRGFGKIRTYGSEEALSDLHHKHNEDDAYDLDRRIELNDYLEELTKVISQNLNKRQRKVIRLHLNGHSFTEIAEMLDTTNRAIYNTVYRARNKIRKKLKGKFEF
jgi:RNA polymerase sigma factor (sigma-70 family)